MTRHAAGRFVCSHVRQNVGTHALASMATAPRKGVAVLWVILMLPVVFLMLVFVAEIGNLWLARVELENALESAALAAVKEWVDASGGSTLTARQVAQTVAAANTVRGNSVAIGLNYTAANLPNENTDGTFPTANQVFGSLSSTSPTVVFASGVAPSCSSGGGGGTPGTASGTVLLDVSSVKSLEQDNAWGFNFKAADASTTANLTISRIVLNLRAGGDPDAVFDLLTTAPRISDNVGLKIPSQADVFGVSNAPFILTTVGTVRTWANMQVRFVWDSAVPYILTINFAPLGVDTGFAPGDRIRFGARVANIPQDDGDGVGVVLTTATVTYAVAGVNAVPDKTATFFNSAFGGNNPPPLDPDVLPNSAPYLLPNAPGNGLGNDRQSYVEITGNGTPPSGGSGTDFAVRVQAQVTVSPICSGLSACIPGPFRVHAHTTAYASCADACPKIIRVDQFVYP